VASDADRESASQGEINSELVEASGQPFESGLNLGFAHEESLNFSEQSRQRIEHGRRIPRRGPT
jgi:hypothetical protein